MSLRLEPMTSAEYDVWRQQAVSEYGEEFVKSGILSPEDAAKRGEDDFAMLLPDGLATENHSIYTAFVDDVPVGTLWLEFRERPGGLQGFVYSLAVDESQRRKGYGRAIMQAGIEECRERGARAIGLNVFGHNDGARALYDSLGFGVESTSMKLTL